MRLLVAAMGGWFAESADICGPGWCSGRCLCQVLVFGGFDGAGMLWPKGCSVSPGRLFDRVDCVGVFV